MKKYEAKELMIGSWVLPYDGKTPRQIVSLTMQKAGFMRDYGRGRDFYRFDQIQGIPLSEELLKNCVTYRDMNPKEPNEQVQSIHCYSDTVIAIHADGETKYKRFRYLHEIQAYLLSGYNLVTVFDVEKFKEAVIRSALNSYTKDMKELCDKYFYGDIEFKFGRD